MRALLRLVRGSIALKLTLTLGGFVAGRIPPAGLLPQPGPRAPPARAPDTPTRRCPPRARPLGAVAGPYEAPPQGMPGGGALALLIALGIGVFVAGRVTHPVVEMQSIARQMSGGNFLVRAPTRSTDEIGTLGR